MSFGGPGLRQPVSKPSPPERGSFPLDHDGECKPIVAQYLKCVRLANGQNAPECRGLAKAYLKCRMERNLMAPDEMKNLGFKDDGSDVAPGSAGSKGGVGIGPRPWAVTGNMKVLHQQQQKKTKTKHITV